MKLLMIYADKFSYKTNIKNLESVEKYEENKHIENTLVGFIQVEKKRRRRYSQNRNENDQKPKMGSKEE